MKQTNSKKLKGLLVALASSSLLVGCDVFDDDDDPVVITPPPANISYEVTVTNLTNAQPLSPVAVALHASESAWEFGMEATEQFEYLTEGGDNSFLLGLSWVVDSASGAGPIGPGLNETITVTTTDSTANLLTVATMLVNTNDAFSGLTALDLSSMQVNDSMSFRLGAYDSGTEANSEAAGTIPGPADGGEGFNAARDDVNFVARHPGVVSQDDGLGSSVLTEQHRFDNPVIAVTVTRTE